MTRWEYKTIVLQTRGGTFLGTIEPGKIDWRGGLDALGNEGWELVNVLPVEKDSFTEHVVYFFKRPLP